MAKLLCSCADAFRKNEQCGLAYFDVCVSEIACAASLALPPPVGLRIETILAGGKIVNRLLRNVGVGIFVGTLLPTLVISQAEQSSQVSGSYALIGMMRAFDESHTVDLDAGYV